MLARAFSEFRDSSSHRATASATEPLTWLEVAVADTEPRVVRGALGTRPQTIAPECSCRIHESFAGLHRRRRVLRGFFDVPRSRACITVRGGRDTGLVTPRSATGRGTLGATSTDTRGGRVLELLAHAIELGSVIRAEPTAWFGRIGAMTSTTTAHRPRILTHYPNQCIAAADHQPGSWTAVRMPARSPCLRDPPEGTPPSLSRAIGW